MKFPRESKVDDLHRPVFSIIIFEHYVFIFQVSMDYIPFVHVVHRGKNLFGYPGSLNLSVAGSESMSVVSKRIATNTFLMYSRIAFIQIPACTEFEYNR